MSASRAEIKSDGGVPATLGTIAKASRNRGGKPDDRAIGLARVAEFEAIEAAVRERGFQVLRPSSADDADAMARILVDIVDTANGRHGEDKYGRSSSGFTSVSFSSRWWHAARHDYAPSVSYDSVVPAIRGLRDAGLIADLQVGKRGTATDVQTRFLASPGLRGVKPPKTVCDPGPRVRMRDTSGTPVRLGMTQAFARLDRFLKLINEAIGSAEYGLAEDCPRARFNGDGTVSFGDRGHTVWTDQEELYAVFNGGWNLGGRWYGGWWQNVSKTERETHFVIEGGRAVEVDHEYLHPKMVYALYGVPLVGDPYIVRNFEDDRKGMKIAFNTMLNASSRPDAVGAVAAFLQHRHEKANGIVTLRNADGFRQPLEGRWINLAGRMVSAVLKAHPRVAGSFLSGVGLSLQNHDAGMLREVMREMTVDRGIVCLPIHDSVLVRGDHKEILVASMAAALERKLEAISGNAVTRYSGYDFGLENPHMRGDGAQGGAEAPLAPFSGPGADLTLVVSPTCAKLAAAPLDLSFIPDFGPDLLQPVRSVEPVPAPPERTYSLDETWVISHLRRAPRQKAQGRHRTACSLSD